VEVVSLSLGRGGFIPPYVASWLPNMLFCAIGGVLVYRSR
jgi:lipopolysaccharide export LptBFGC system permease protein LptF